MSGACGWCARGKGYGKLQYANSGVGRREARALRHALVAVDSGTSCVDLWILPLVHRTAQHRFEVNDAVKSCGWLHVTGAHQSQKESRRCD